MFSYDPVKNYVHSYIVRNPRKAPRRPLASSWKRSLFTRSPPSNETYDLIEEAGTPWGHLAQTVEHAWSKVKEMLKKIGVSIMVSMLCFLESTSIN